MDLVLTPVIGHPWGLVRDGLVDLVLEKWVTKLVGRLDLVSASTKH